MLYYNDRQVGLNVTKMILFVQVYGKDEAKIVQQERHQVDWLQQLLSAKKRKPRENGMTSPAIDMH